MLSGSLRERMNRLKALKEEEKREEEKRAAALPEESPAPVETAPSPSETAALGSTPAVHEQTDEEEEIVETVVESSEQDVVSDEDEPSQSEVEPSQVESEQDQDVFKALDEAERADNVSDDGAPNDAEPKTVTEIDAKGAQTSRCNKKCIILTTIFLACVAIVAIVLPFYLEYPPGWRKSDANSPTMSPTSTLSNAPTTLQWGQFMQAFFVPISGEDVFKDKTSPQYLAAEFMVGDSYTADVPTTGLLNDRYASATFYFATGGENWNSCYFGDETCESGQWLVGDVCDWYGVSCDDDGRVVSYVFADAEGNGLDGALPPEMRLMSFMTDLVIVNNAIKGTIPEAFWDSATSMRSLLLPDNELTGEIPDDFFGKSPLAYVHLANNKFSGTIPTTIGKTTTLQQLDLSGNVMSGTIPEAIAGYEALEALSFANNYFEGSIPEEIYYLTDLKFLHLNENELTGTVSRSIGNLSLLKELRVGGSALSGQLPDEFYSLTDLVEVDISQSSFDGRLSLGFLNMEGLEKLNVAGNQLIGTVPVDFGYLSELSDLNLEGNDFSGVIPESVCSLQEENLEVLTADCEICDCCSICF